MPPKLKPETAAWWNGQNQETEASTYFLRFVLSLNVWILQVWRLVIFTVETIQRYIRCFAVLCKVVMFSKFIQIKSSIYKQEKNLKAIKIVIA